MNKKNLTWVVLIAGLAFAIYQYTKYRVPSKVDFQTIKLYNLDQSDYTLNDGTKKLILVNFWATWCGPCVKEMPLLETVYNELPNKSDWKFVTVAEEDFALIQKFKSRRNYTMDFTISDEQFSEYGIFTYPTTFIINAKGEILESWTGDLRSKEEFLKLLEKHK